MGSSRSRSESRGALFFGIVAFLTWTSYSGATWIANQHVPAEREPRLIEKAGSCLSVLPANEKSRMSFFGEYVESESGRPGYVVNTLFWRETSSSRMEPREMVRLFRENQEGHLQGYRLRLRSDELGEGNEVLLDDRRLRPVCRRAQSGVESCPPVPLRLRVENRVEVLIREPSAKQVHRPRIEEDFDRSALAEALTTEVIGRSLAGFDLRTPDRALAESRAQALQTCIELLDDDDVSEAAAIALSEKINQIVAAAPGAQRPASGSGRGVN